MPYNGGLYGIKVGQNQGFSTENMAYGTKNMACNPPPPEKGGCGLGGVCRHTKTAKTVKTVNTV